jgi:K+-sensing histidine kinase KdpD
VLIAWGCVLLWNSLLSFPPFIFFALAVMAAVVYSGYRSGLVALVLSTLLSDFFFIHPTYEFSIDGSVLKLSLFYLLGGVLTLFIGKRLAARHRSFIFFSF